MANVTMSLHGFDAIERAMQAAPKLVETASVDLVEKSSRAAAQRMRTNAPVKTGLLKRSITTVTKGLEGGVLIADEASYWRFPEYGTIHMPAQPFVRPAAEAERPVTVRRLDDIGKQLEQSWPTGVAI